MKKFLKGTFTTAFIIVAVALPLSQKQNISDWNALRQYQPSKQVQALADSTAMTDYGSKLFYVNDPQIIADKTTFRSKCTQMEESIVLGCYISKQGIFLYSVSDIRLNGVVEVTAAHEMLHVAYERLSIAEKNRINNLLDTTFKQVNDQRIIQTVQKYQKSDPSVVNNELHSILATEVENLSPELESYYSKYFTNRSKITNLSSRYENEFAAREAAVETYDAQLKSMKTAIDQDLAQADQLSQALATEKSRLDSYKNSGDISLYNNSVPEYNSLVGQYNALVRKLQAEIDQYNGFVEKRNSLAGDIQTLIEAIDSRPQIKN